MLNLHGKQSGQISFRSQLFCLILFFSPYYPKQGSKAIILSDNRSYNQVIKLLDKSKTLRISRQPGGERYIKRFDN